MTHGVSVPFGLLAGNVRCLGGSARVLSMLADRLDAEDRLAGKRGEPARWIGFTDQLRGIAAECSIAEAATLQAAHEASIGPLIEQHDFRGQEDAV